MEQYKAEHSQLNEQREQGTRTLLGNAEHTLRRRVTVAVRTSYPQLATKPRSLVSTLCFQVFVKTPVGKTHLLWVYGIDYVKHLKNIISQQVGYSTNLQNLIHGGRALQGSKHLKDYKIASLSTITLNLRLRGGVADNNKIPYRGEGSGNCLAKNVETH